MDAIKKKKNNVLNDKLNSKGSYDGNGDANNKNNNNKPRMTPQETEILNKKEDALIKKAQISAYKKALKIAKGIDDRNLTVVLKQNLQEKEFAYDKIKTSEDRMLNDIRSNNNNNSHHEYFNLGSAVADMLTSYWNSKENPSKVYIFNRRVHHGAVGALLGFSGWYKNNPLVTGILSGLGAGLQKDDYNDFKEWFLSKKKEEDTKESK